MYSFLNPYEKQRFEESDFLFSINMPRNNLIQKFSIKIRNYRSEIDSKLKRDIHLEYEISSASRKIVESTLILPLFEELGKQVPENNISFRPLDKSIIIKQAETIPYSTKFFTPLLSEFILKILKSSSYKKKQPIYFYNEMNFNNSKKNVEVLCEKYFPLLYSSSPKIRDDDIDMEINKRYLITLDGIGPFKNNEIPALFLLARTNYLLAPGSTDKWSLIFKKDFEDIIVPSEFFKNQNE